VTKPLAFVLGGGGARGALQVGALQALLESDYQPDLLVGTSAGAINATFLAMHGFTKSALDGLITAWGEAASADLLPANYLWLTVRTLFNRERTNSYHRMREFFIEHGVSPELRFSDLPGPRLIQVCADINQRCSVLYGPEPNQSVLEGLLASTALPPWTQPLRSDRGYLMDGGVVSNLPIEPALTQGARHIIALNISEPRDLTQDHYHFGAFVNKLVETVSQRLLDLELELAARQGVSVQQIHLHADQPIALWDFSHTSELIVQGHQIADRVIAEWKPRHKYFWQRWLAW
jgi:NTE family protein